MVTVSNVNRRRVSKSITNDLGSSSQNSDSTAETAKPSAKRATTKSLPPWLRKDRTEGANKQERAAQVNKNLKEHEYERIPDERKARQTPEEGEARRQEVLRRRVDEFKKGGATHSKAFGR
jgi:hypothetical protein